MGRENCLYIWLLKQKVPCDSRHVFVFRLYAKNLCKTNFRQVVRAPALLCKYTISIIDFIQVERLVINYNIFDIIITYVYYKLVYSDNKNT